MGTKQSTDRNPIDHKQTVQRFIADINSKSFDSFQDYFDQNAEFQVFSVKFGKYVNTQGIENIIYVFKQNFEGNDAILNIDKIIVEGNICAISGFIAGRSFFTISGSNKLDDPFKIKIMAFIELGRSGKISKFDFSQHTFEVMRLAGAAILKIGDHEQIQNYLNSLKEFGIIPVNHRV